MPAQTFYRESAIGDLAIEDPSWNRGIFIGDLEIERSSPGVV
jgi:hypothetical protein